MAEKDMNALLDGFEEAMRNNYEVACHLKPPYHPTKFRTMLNEHGAKKTADILLESPNPAYGFTELLLRGKECLKLSVEYLVLSSPWNQLFKPSQLAIAKKRLLSVECDLPVDDGIKDILEVPFAEELPENSNLYEGAIRIVRVNAYERNPIARNKCIEHYGATCVVCGLDFGKMYGSVANGFIHVHHLIPLHEISASYQVNPIADLRPVCPNCHSIIHLNGVCRSIEEVKNLLKRRNQP
jgi:hypothetical protein